MAHDSRESESYHEHQGLNMTDNKVDQAFPPLHLHTVSNRKTEQWEGLGMRLVLTYLL